MMRSFRRKLRNALFKMRETTQLENAAVLAGQVRADQILAKGKLAKLSEAGFCVYCQNDEDGILSWLIERTNPQNLSFVEFGVHDYRESNSRFILQTRNWSGLVIDSDPNNIASLRTDALVAARDLQAISSFVTKDNIAGLIRDAGFERRIGLLSIDIDGVDYWVLEKIEFDSDIIVVEFNDFLGELPVSVPYTHDFSRHRACVHGNYWGASLSAFRHLLEGRDYIFVGTNLVGTNAFFVHRDHAEVAERWLDNIVAHRSIMRETRDSDGRLAFVPYAGFRNKVAELPLIRVDTGETVTCGDMCRQ